MTDNRTDTRSPAEIEQEIRTTQRDMSRTVEQLESEFTPRNLLNAALDRAEANNVDARYMLDTARRNPLALGMITIGGLWLVSDADARPSALKPSFLGSSGDKDNGGWDDTYHRNYVEHMARCEPRADEDEMAYRRRRDAARGTYLLIEQDHDEDESSYRKRLGEATDRMRQQRDSMMEHTRQAGSQARRKAGQAASSARGAYYDNPLVGGLIAAFVGASAGALLPATRTEEEYLGGAGAKALDQAQAKAKQAGQQMREKKDELVDQADHKMNDDTNPGDQAEQSESFQTV